MLPQYLVSLGATNLRKSKTKVPRLSILFKLIKKGPFMSIYWWKASTSFSKDAFYDKASGSALFLIFS